MHHTVCIGVSRGRNNYFSELKVFLFGESSARVDSDNVANDSIFFFVMSQKVFVATNGLFVVFGH
jgi:hypothetical protein